MALGGMVFGYVMCNIQSNSSAAVEGFRRLKLVTALFSVAILLVSCSCDNTPCSSSTMLTAAKDSLGGYGSI